MQSTGFIPHNPPDAIRCGCKQNLGKPNWFKRRPCASYYVHNYF